MKLNIPMTVPPETHNAQHASEKQIRNFAANLGEFTSVPTFWEFGSISKDVKLIHRL